MARSKDGEAKRERGGRSRSGPRSDARSVKGRRLGPYRLLEHLADGGMAEIFLARRELDASGVPSEPEAPGAFGKDLVLKVLQDRFATDPHVVAMFLEEARLSAELRHPNIVDVHDIGEDDGVRYIAMEYIEGRTLTDVVTRSFEVGNPLPLPHAVHIVAEVAAGLHYLEAGLPGRGRAPGVIHRDISPSNIVVGFAGHTKIIDFGIARRRAVGDDERGTRPGKVSYMSPEQVKGQSLDTRSDLFALGTILYEITLGKRLWRGPAEVVMRRIVEEAVAPPTYLRRDYPPALERIVLRALEKRPQDRFASAGDMLAELDRFLASLDPAARDRTVERPGNADMRVGVRPLGEFVRSLYAPGAKVSEGGALRAQIFQDDDGAIADPELVALDFDRARPGSGAALAHALRGAEPYELAAEVTSVTLLAEGNPVSPGSNPAPRVEPPRWPDVVSPRNGGDVPPLSGHGFATAQGEVGDGARDLDSGAPAKSRLAFIAAGVVLTILLGVAVFALQ